MDDDGATSRDHLAMTSGRTKDRWRARLRAARAAVPYDVRSARDAALARHVLALARAGSVVCAFVPMPSEPGSAAMLDGLLGAGVEVLLPVVTGAGPLDWAPYTGVDALVDAAFGLREPDGTRLGPQALAHAGHVLVPALAVAHDGTRLGRGGGFYDRSLPLADPAALVVGVVDDAEIVPALPVDPHDVPVRWCLTPGRGCQELRRLRGRGG